MQFIGNALDFDQSYAFDTLDGVLYSSYTVLYLLLTDEQQDSYSRLTMYQEIQNDDFVYALKQPFLSYGIAYNQVTIASPYEQSISWIQKKMEQADILVLLSNSSRQAMRTIQQLSLAPLLKQYAGIIFWLGETGRILSDEFYVNDEDRLRYPGLSLYEKILIDTNYVEEPNHIETLIRFLEQEEKSILILPGKSGVILDENRMELLGQAFIATENDLDEMYLLRDSLQETC